MELATHIVNLLKNIGDSKFSDELYDKLVRKVFDSFRFDENETLKIDYVKSSSELSKLNFSAKLVTKRVIFSMFRRN